MEKNLPEKTIAIDSKDLYYQIGHIYSEIGEKEIFREIKNFIKKIDKSAKIKFLTGTNAFKSNKSNLYLKNLIKSYFFNLIFQKLALHWYHQNQNYLT